MKTQRKSKWSAIVFAFAAIAAVPVLAQNGPPDGGGPGGPGGGPGGPGGPDGGPGGRPNFAQHRKHDIEDIQDDLNLADDKWKALEPKVEKLMDLHDELSPHGGPPRHDQDGKASNPVQAALHDLREVIDQKDARPEEIKAKVEAYEKAKANAAVEMKKAEEEIKTGLSPLEQAILIAHGVLD